MTIDDYVLGHDDHELLRLEQQARVLAPATRAILTLAGIEHGMRVLDVGSGAGDVAFEVAGLVGPSGAVVGIDRAPAALDRARRRADDRGLTNVTFVDGDVNGVEVDGPFDAVVGRLVLLYTPDPVRVLERSASLIRPGGVVVAMEYDMTSAGAWPPEPLATEVVSWIVDAFAAAGNAPDLGLRLGLLFVEAGLTSPVTLGLQTYLQPDDPVGPQMASGVVRSLLPAIVATGLADEAEIGLDTLADRIGSALRAANALFKPPALVGCWARV